MKKVFVIIGMTVAVGSYSMAGVAKDTVQGKRGAELFKAHCAVCHPEGGNIITPGKTLHKKNRDANKINKSEDIVKKMRNPGPGMTPFDKATLSDSDAGKIAQYILKTFK